MIQYDTVIGNPPFSGSLHLDIISSVLPFMSKRATGCFIHPATWLINVRKNGKAKIYDELKKKLKGHIKSIEIENLNNEFKTGLYSPFSTTTIDMSKTYNSIDFICCGETKKVDSLYKCNMIGDNTIIWNILNKVKSYGDMMSNHITKEPINGDDIWYAKYSEIVSIAGCTMTATATSSDANVMYASDTYWRTNSIGTYLSGYFAVGFHIQDDNVISKNIHYAKKQGASKEYKENPTTNIYGTKQQLENWKHFIFNNKLPLFINIVLTIDQHNNSKEFLPWLVDKQYTDEEINKKFKFTDEEIKLIDDTLKKFERHSPWFKRYMCGKEDFINISG